MISSNGQTALERAVARRNGVEAYMPVEILTVDDIRKVIAKLDPNHRSNKAADEAVVETKMVGANHDNGQATFGVSAKMTSYSQRESLIRALNDIKEKKDKAELVASKQVEPLVVNGRVVPTKLNVKTGRLPIDDIISRALGGRREDTSICWDLADGYTYRYNVYEHKLTRAKTNAADSH